MTATEVGNVSCDSNPNGGAYFHFVGQNQVMITVEGSSGGVTSFDALDKASNAFVKTYAETGDIHTAVDAANRVLARIPGKDEQNVGDQVKRNKVN